jgi:cell division septation protein DedD
MADHYRGLAQSLVELGFLFRRQGERRREVWRNRQTNQEVTFDRDEVTRSRPAADAVLAAAQTLLDNPPAVSVVEKTSAKPTASSKAGAAASPVKSSSSKKPSSQPKSASQPKPSSTQPKPSSPRKPSAKSATKVPAKSPAKPPAKLVENPAAKSVTDSTAAKSKRPRAHTPSRTAGKGAKPAPRRK